MNKKITLAGALLAATASMVFSQNCDQYLNQQTKTVNTKAIVVKILGKTVDGLLGTSFSKLSTSFDQLQYFDGLQYQVCMKLEKVKSDYEKDKWEARLEQTLADMLQLINQSEALPGDVVKQLVAGGAITQPQPQATTTPQTSTAPAMPTTATKADDVAVPQLTIPKRGGVWEDEEVPCDIPSSNGIIRAHGISDPTKSMPIAKELALTVARAELASKIEVSVKSTTHYFIERTETNLPEEIKTRLEKNIDLTVDQVLRMNDSQCAKLQKNSETQMYRYFVSVEINEANVLKPIYEKLKKEPGLENAVPNYEKFKNTVMQSLMYLENTRNN